MKNFWKAFGKGLLYFLVYFGIQQVVSMVYMMIESMSLTMEMMSNGEELDPLVLTELLTNKIYENAMTLTLISGILILLTYWIICLVRKKKLFQEVGIVKMPALGFLPVAFAGLSFNVVISVFISYFPFPQSWVNSYAEKSSVLVEGNMFVAYFATIIMAPILEEVVFRGFLYSRLKKGMPLIVAAILTSVTFGCMHGTMIWGIYTFIFSMVLIYILERFHSLAACICFHMAFNAAGMLLTAIPEISDVTGIVITVICAVVFAGSVVWLTLLTKNMLQNNIATDKMEENSVRKSDMISG